MPNEFNQNSPRLILSNEPCHNPTISIDTSYEALNGMVSSATSESYYLNRTNANISLDLDTCVKSIISELNLRDLTCVSSETTFEEKDNEKEKKEMMNHYEIRNEAERRAKDEKIEISRKRVDELAEIIKQEEALNEAKEVCSKFTPKRIIYNDPVTIVFWKDGTKTIVRATKETIFNKYNAFTAALAKKILMSNSNVNRIVDRGE